jgi:hypothetical protein
LWPPRSGCGHADGQLGREPEDGRIRVAIGAEWSASIPNPEVPVMRYTRRLLAGAAAAAVTAALVWGPSAVLAGISASALD